MANNVTLLQDMINPEVMADMISYELENKLKLTGFYRVDRSLTGRAGDTITVPSWKYLGMAEIVPENSQVPSREMSAEDVSYTIHKAAIEATLTDEVLLSAHGNPVQETTRQLRMSIQERMEEDGIEQLRAITAANGHVYPVTGGKLDYNAIVEAVDLLKLEDDENLFLHVNSTRLKDVRLDPRFVDRFTAGGDRLLHSGIVGSIAGCQVSVSNRLETDEAYILKDEALTAFMKRDINLETEREMSFKRTKFGTDAHYVVAIEDFDKIVKMTF